MYTTRNLKQNKKRGTNSNLAFMKPPFKDWLKELFSGKSNANAPTYEKDKVVHSTTFDNTAIPTPATRRDFTETEYTMELHCYDKKTNQLIENPTWLYALLSANEWNATEELAPLSSNAAYLTNADDQAEYNQVPWDQQSHNDRTENSYVWLAIPNEDIPAGSSSATPLEDRVTIGFDLFDDYYFDTDDYDLLERDYTIRTRLRFSNATGNSRIQRLLIQVKQGAIVSDEGLKEVHKYEYRLDRRQGDNFPDPMIDELLDDTKKGVNEWEHYRSNGTGTPTSNYINPIQRIYADLRLIEEIEVILMPLKKTPDIATRDTVVKQLEAMQVRTDVIASADVSELLRVIIADLKKAANETEIAGVDYLSNDLKGEALLPEADGMTDIMAIEEKAFIRSYRGRFHLSETNPDSIKLFYEEGKNILAALQAPIQTYAADEKAVKHEEIKKLSEQINQLLSTKPADSKTADSFNNLFTGLTVGNSPRTTFENIISATTLNRTDAIPSAAEVDAMDQEKIIADRVNEVYQLIADNLSANNNTIYSLVAKGVAATDALTNILKIREAGSAVQGLWFDRAREFYVPTSNRVLDGSGDFIIDTFDVSGMYSADTWGNTPVGDRRNTSQPDQTKMVSNRVSNDLQIEADREEPYRLKMDALITKMETDATGNQPLLDKIKELRNVIDKEGTGSAKISTLMKEIKQLGSANPAVTLDVRLYEGASFVFDQYKNKLKLMAQNKERALLLKIQALVDEARKTNTSIPDCYFKWEPVLVSRGETALDLVKKAGK